jgi:hypothetical protein
MRNKMIGTLLASAAMGIPMSPIERQMGRLMRGPDHPKDPIEAMMDDGGVEGQWSEGDDKGKPAPKKDDEPKNPPVDDAGDEGDDDADDNGGDDDDADEGKEGEEGEEEGKQKTPKKSAKERIQQLNRELREERRARAADAVERENLALRMERLEKGLPPGKTDDTKIPEAVAPDPTDLAKYPLGALDDGYIEDKIEFIATKKAEENLDRSLQRQQDMDQQAENDRIISDLTAKVDVFADKGAELFDDFDEKVVQAGMKGEYPLTQETFEACADAEHGPAILRELALDKKEAARVAALSPYNQLKYVAEKNDEKAGKSKPRLTKAGDPPKETPKGARGKYEVADDTDDLDAFGKKFDKV